MATTSTDTKVKSIDQLVVLPDATNIFDLREGDIQDIMAKISDFLERNKHKNFYVFRREPLGILDADGYREIKDWELHRNEAMEFVKIGNDMPEGEANYSGNRDLHLVFRGRETYAVIGSPNLRLNKMPRFAFLANAEEDSSNFAKDGPRGLYVSSGIGDTNPWFYRHDQIIVTRYF